MSEPSFGVDLARLQAHCRLLVNQPITDFQEKHGVLIDEISVDLIEVSSINKPYRQILNFKINVIPK